MGFFQGLFGPQGLQQLGPNIRERILRGRKEEREDLLLKNKMEREGLLLKNKREREDRLRRDKQRRESFFAATQMPGLSSEAYGLLAGQAPPGGPLSTALLGRQEQQKAAETRQASQIERKKLEDMMRVAIETKNPDVIEELASQFPTTQAEAYLSFAADAREEKEHIRLQQARERQVWKQKDEEFENDRIQWGLDNKLSEIAIEKGIEDLNRLRDKDLVAWNNIPPASQIEISDLSALNNEMKELQDMLNDTTPIAKGETVTKGQLLRSFLGGGLGAMYQRSITSQRGTMIFARMPALVTDYHTKKARAVQVFLRTDTGSAAPANEVIEYNKLIGDDQMAPEVIFQKLTTIRKTMTNKAQELWKMGSAGRGLVMNPLDIQRRQERQDAEDKEALRERIKKEKEKRAESRRREKEAQPVNLPGVSDFARE